MKPDLEEEVDLVCEVFQIDELELSERAQVCDYWENAYKFYEKVKNKPITKLSKSMTDWLTKIEFDLNEEV